MMDQLAHLPVDVLIRTGTPLLGDPSGGEDVFRQLVAFPHPGAGHPSHDQGEPLDAQRQRGDERQEHQQDRDLFAHPTPFKVSSLAKWQDTECPGDSSSVAGAIVLQISRAYGQRG